VDNITHSLVGAALAELALPTDATRTQRRTFVVVGIIAANLPDADLFYSRIAPPPLGYLLHHRGHTHTLDGLVAQAALLGAVCLLPMVRRQIGAAGRRLAVLIIVGLISHLVLDSWNSYGVHPFWPFDARWIYGDVIYIVEPWLWLVLGVSAALNMRQGWGRIALGAVLVGPVVAATMSHVIPVMALEALAVAAVVLMLVTRRWLSRPRAGSALALVALFVASMFVIRQRVRGEVLASMDATMRGQVLDVVLSPQPANPLCWRALTISADDARGVYATTRASVTPFGRSGCGRAHQTTVVSAATQQHSLTQLRDLYHRDCWVRAWMRFGRAPVVDDGTISDLRFGELRANFTTMRLQRDSAVAAVCPRYLPTWGTTRGDLLGD
jgi:inner membrane protein